MKLSLLEDGVLDYKGDVAHPATPQGSPKTVPGSGVAGAGVDMSPEEDDESLLKKTKRKIRKKNEK